jgi:hypothetical protein
MARTVLQSHQPEAQARQKTWPRLRFGLVFSCTIVAAMALLGNLTFGQESGPLPAKVTLSGKEANILTVDGPGGKTQYVVLEIEGGTTVKVKTNQDIAALNDRLLGEHRKLGSEFTQRVKLLVQKNDIQGIKKAEQDFKAASDELLENLSYYTAEGTVSLTNGQIEMDGQLRLFADKALGKGKAMVIGTPIAIKDKEGQLHLAVQNGANPILVTGKQPETTAGTITIRGLLRTTGKGTTLTLSPD